MEESQRCTYLQKRQLYTDPRNYRPVSLTNIYCRAHNLFTSISHLDKYTYIVRKQHGFQSQQSCESQLLGVVNNDFSKALNAVEQIDALFLDFAKALRYHMSDSAS